MREIHRSRERQLIEGTQSGGREAWAEAGKGKSNQRTVEKLVKLTGGNIAFWFIMGFNDDGEEDPMVPAPETAKE